MSWCPRRVRAGNETDFALFLRNEGNIDAIVDIKDATLALQEKLRIEDINIQGTMPIPVAILPPGQNVYVPFCLFKSSQALVCAAWLSAPHC